MKQRIERMAVLVRKAVGNELVRVLPDRRVTIHDVNVSPDLRHAVIWVSAFDSKQSSILDDIQAVQPQLQRVLGKSLERTKFVPRLQFRLDETDARQNRVEDVLNSL